MDGLGCQWIAEPTHALAEREALANLQGPAFRIGGLPVSHANSASIFHSYSVGVHYSRIYDL